MDNNFYFNVFYPFQDQVLRVLSKPETGFYLTGGTAASRGYLDHRFSDDLDFFVNDDDRFGLWADRWIQALTQESDWQTQVTLRDERFVRMILTRPNVTLKIEMVNDVPAHVGKIRLHPVLGRLDSPENILANKITAVIDRQAPKDLADIWGFCCQLGLSLTDAIEGAQGKAMGIFPADLARVLCSVTPKDWEIVRWIKAPEVNQYIADLTELGEKLILLT